MPIKFLIFLCLLNYINCKTIYDAASYARYMMSNEMKCTFATHYFNNSTYAYSSMEDFAESYEKNGYPVFLLADISITAKNLVRNPEGSISINVGNCSKED